MEEILESTEQEEQIEDVRIAKIFVNMHVASMKLAQFINIINMSDKARSN